MLVNPDTQPTHEEPLNGTNGDASPGLAPPSAPNEEDEYTILVPTTDLRAAGRMIQLNTSSAYANARRRLRTWLRTLPDNQATSS